MPPLVVQSKLGKKGVSSRLGHLHNYVLRGLEKHWFYLALLVPVAFTSYLVCAYGVNVPFIDDWTIVPTLQHIHEHTFRISDLWAQHYEHRIFFSNLVTVLLAQVTRWNLFVEMLLNLVLNCGILLLLCRYIYKAAKTRVLCITATLATSVILFSPVQWENWLWGWQIGWSMCIFFGLSALLLLDSTTSWSTSRWRFALAAVCCVIATYSLGSGILFWAAGAVQLLGQRYNARRTALWGAIAVASAVLYVYRYHYAASDLSTQLPLAEYVRFFFSYIGSPLVHTVTTATAFGLILSILTLLIMHVARVRQKISITRLALPLGLIMFVIFSDVITTISRVPISGSEGALYSRYVSASCLLIIALLLMLIQMRLHKKVWLATVIALVLLLLPNYWYGATKLIQKGHDSRASAACLRQPNPTIECLSEAYVDSSQVRKWITFLKQEHLGGF